MVAQALVGLLEFATTVAGLAARVYWKVTLPRERSVQVPPHAASFVFPLSRPQAMLEMRFVWLNRKMIDGAASLAAGVHELPLPYLPSMTLVARLGLLLAKTWTPAVARAALAGARAGLS